MWLILSGDWKVVKMGRFWPKSKAIHLVFCPIFTKIQCDSFWVEIEKWWKWAEFDQKVRLYTWYFDQFSPKFNVTDFEWRLKSGENGSDFDQKVSLYTWYFAHFHHFSISTQNQSHWILVKMGKIWPKSIGYTFGHFAQFSPKFNVTDFEWRLKSGENGQILTKK